MVFSKFKIQIWAGGWKFSPGSLTWAWAGLASLLARPHLMWEWEWLLGLLRGQPGAWRSRHQHHERLLNAETQKSCSAFCHLDYWGLINKQPLFASLCPVSYLASIFQLMFCGSAVILATLHVGGNCMFAGTPSKQSGCVPMRSQPWLR